MKTTVFDTNFGNKTLSKELQDYKEKSVKGLQGYICLREGLQDYKRGRITKVFLREKERESYLGPKTVTGNLNLRIEPAFCLQSLSIYR